ncbi:Putative_reverse transcriptase/endonuclease [Hexamita inflata]|uniref:Reverse transcriptase/endonuclease n=1 Tax=Hexamita inflata TaxID=28002 RepID=A0AA86NL28_9EUKA|nr:Putative reverse transcriptase/endonuclease [Hexamita inflata]CAI9921060.1 Putative reverse transcriptase/endonuclease [Hexamita inflata]
MLAEAMEEILESDLATKDLLDVMILSKDDGGLDLITPGAYFDLMIQNRDIAFQDPTKVNKETRDFFSKIRHDFINSKQYTTNVKSEVKLGHCLDNYYQITNNGFQFLVNIRFNKKQKYISLDTKCDLCNCKNDIYTVNCKKLQRNHILTHNYFVRQLADKMIDAGKVREVKEVSKNNNNRTDQRHKADISYIKDGKQQFFDIDISWDTERYFAVKQKHYQTETVNCQSITCTPIIIGNDTTVHPESLAALRQVGIEKQLLYQQVGILVSNYREQTDYVFREKARKAQDQPTELNIQETDDQTDEISSIPVNETTNSNAGTHRLVQSLRKNWVEISNAANLANTRLFVQPKNQNTNQNEVAMLICCVFSPTYSTYQIYRLYNLLRNCGYCTNIVIKIDLQSNKSQITNNDYAYL